MTDLKQLKVSLTKHNAHKIARLLKSYKVDQILARLDEVRAEKAQAYKNLSVLSGDKVPEVWSKAKRLGDNAIDALVLVGIIFSHNDLVKALLGASNRNGFSGQIVRGVQLDGKAYTNFARVIDQLGYALKLDYQGVTFNLRAMFSIPGLGPLVKELVALKLAAAKWDGSGSVMDEAVALNFHKVFGVSDKELRDWMTADAQPVAAGSSFLPKDEEFFQADDEGKVTKEFVFKAGHTERAIDGILKASPPKTKATQLHNDIQNRLYTFLCKQVGAQNVGTELDTGSGTTIDVVTRIRDKVTFFEIKTASSVRTNIRHAIPQLLEYAFWPPEKRADELVIVSHLKINKDAERYLAYLRSQFELPLSYRQFDLMKNELI